MSYKQRSFPAHLLPFETLESRRLLAAVAPNDYEQFLVELINRGRADPVAEASRYGVALNEGVPSEDTISTTAKQPLAINPNVTDAARDHSQWMIDTNTFSHTGQGGSNPQDRMTDAGYVFTGSWTWGENIATNGSSGSINAATETANAHRNLFVDENYPGRGHRVNLMSNSFREIGAGVVTGLFNGFNSVMVTEDFATSGSNVYLTGVVYNDNVSNDDFYTPGEGLGAVTITATRVTDNATFTTQTWDSGGYSLAVPAGTYNLTANGAGTAGLLTHNNVVVGSENVKRDFTPDMVSPFATVSNGKLTVVGTLGVDAIIISYASNAYTVTRNATSTTLSGAGVTSIDVYGYDGDDYVLIETSVPLGAYIDAGAGADYIQGGDHPDTITAGAGKDRAFGGLGDDRVAGNGGHDRLYGEAGRDRMYGGEGNDTMEGGSSGDRFWPEGGNNTCYGQGGDDRFYARNTFADVLVGQVGTDHAQTDDVDYLEGVEEILP